MTPRRLGPLVALFATSLIAPLLAQTGDIPDIPDIPSCLGTTQLPIYFTETIDGQTRHFLEGGVFGVLIDETGRLTDQKRNPFNAGEPSCWENFLLEVTFQNYDPTTAPSSTDVDGDGRSSLAEFIQGTSRTVADEPLYPPYVIRLGNAEDGSPVLYLDTIFHQRALGAPFKLTRSGGDGVWVEVSDFAFEGCEQPAAPYVRYLLRIPIESPTEVPFVRLEWTLNKLSLVPPVF